MISGVVLAGGESLRMGVDKAEIVLNDDVTMLDHVVTTLSAVCEEIVVVGGKRNRSDARCVEDAFPGEGPLGGLVTGMAEARGDIVLALACDLPGLTTTAPEALCVALSQTNADFAVPLARGRRQWLCSAWKRRAGDVLSERFRAGERSIRWAVGGLSETAILLADDAPLTDADTLEALEALL